MSRFQHSKYAIRRTNFISHKKNKLNFTYLKIYKIFLQLSKKLRLKKNAVEKLQNKYK